MQEKFIAVLDFVLILFSGLSAYTDHLRISAYLSTIAFFLLVFLALKNYLNEKN